MSAAPTGTAPERPAQVLAGMLAGARLAQAVSAAAKLGLADLLRDGPRAPSPRTASSPRTPRGASA